MTTGTATGAPHSKKRNIAPTKGHASKAQRRGEGDAPTALISEEQNEDTDPDNRALRSEHGDAANKENTFSSNGGGTNGCPVRSKAGKNGHNEKLAALALKLRPDLDEDSWEKKNRKRTGKGKSTFPAQARDNELAPPEPPHHARGVQPRPRKAAAPTVAPITTTSDGPLMRQPAKPDQPLLACPPAPLFQFSRPGSQFGFSAPTVTANTSNVNEVNQVPVQARDSTPTGICPLKSNLVANPEHAQQFSFPPSLGLSNNIHNAAHDTVGQTGNMDLNIFAPPVQQGLGVFSNHQNISNHPDANNYYADEYYANGQNNIANGQHRFASPFPQVDNYGMGSLGNFSHGRNEGTDAFDLEDDQFLVPIPNISPVRSQGNRAQDLFLPQPHGFASDDDAEGDGNDEDDGDNREREDDEHDEDDDEDMYYEKRNSNHNIERNDIIEVDEASPSEDEAIALAALHASPRANTTRADSNDEEDDRMHVDRHAELRAKGKDILHAHRIRNRAQKPPQAGYLKQVASVQSANRRSSLNHAQQERNAVAELSEEESPSEESDTPNEIHSKPSKKSTAAQSSTKKEHTLKFYPQDWIAVLTEAQHHSHRHLILGREHPFPKRSADLHEAHDILTSVISEHLNNGQLLDDTYTHTRNMDVCVFGDHSSWRSRLKKAAIPIVEVQFNDLINPPNDFHGRQEEACHIIQQQLKEVLDDTSFHFYGRDKNNRTNNFSHPAISKIITNFFYDGEQSLTALYPDDFSNAVPVNAITLVLTVISNCLEEWAVYGVVREKISFKGERYLPTFISVMNAIEETMDDTYHAAKFQANHVKWARQGMLHLHGNVKKTLANKRPVQIVLD